MPEEYELMNDDGEFAGDDEHIGISSRNAPLSKIVFMNHRSDDKRDRDTSSPWKIVEGDSRQKESFEFQPMDWSTFHSGCTLKAGNKYIANQWLTRSVVESLCEMRVHVKEEKEKTPKKEKA